MLGFTTSNSRCSGMDMFVMLCSSYHGSCLLQHVEHFLAFRFYSREAVHVSTRT